MVAISVCDGVASTRDTSLKDVSWSERVGSGTATPLGGAALLAGAGNTTGSARDLGDSSTAGDCCTPGDSRDWEVGDGLLTLPLGPDGGLSEEGGE